MNVNIYIYQTIRGPGTKKGAYAYILETEIKGKTVTLSDVNILEPMSENKAELVTLLKALKRLRTECDLNIIGAGNPIKTGIETWIDKWIHSDWKNAKGKEVANMTEWQQLATYKDKYNITVSDQEEHQYKNWMKSEAEKKLKEVKDGDKT